MRSGLLHGALAAAFVLTPRLAAAQTAVTDGGGDDLVVLPNDSGSIDASTRGDAGLVDASMAAIACEAGVCDTRDGTTCLVAGGAPGRASGTRLTLFGTVGVLAGIVGVAIRRRRSRGRSPSRLPARDAE